MIVSDLMTRKPHIIEAGASIYDAVVKMKMTGCGILPVGTYEKILGVVTDRDILIRLFSQELDIHNVCINKIMSETIYLCHEEDSLKKAIHKMNRCQVRRILIFNASMNLTGILSITDILRRIKNRSYLVDVFSDQF